MAYILPTTGYVTAYGSLTIYNATTRKPSSTVKITADAIDQTTTLPDGRIIDLATAENTIWIPSQFTQRYIFTSGGIDYLRTILQYIDNNTQQTITFYAVDGYDSYTCTGRMTRAIEVTPIEHNDWEAIEVACTFKPSSVWTT